jgi:hypothetical protein
VGPARPMPVRRVAEHADVPPEVLSALRAVCLALPEAHEEQAWAGTRWRIRTKTFAHVVMVDDGWPPAYARAVGSDGPVVVLTFRAAGGELAALGAAGPPFFKPMWFHDIVGLVLDEGTDWVEVAELVTDSWRLLAPRTLVARFDGGG